MKVELMIVNDQYFDLSYPLKNEFSIEGGTIGENVYCDWCLNDNRWKLKDIHCYISFENDMFYITDFSDQVYINDSLFAIGFDITVRLNKNDILYIGPYVIRVNYLKDTIKIKMIE